MNLSVRAQRNGQIVFHAQGRLALNLSEAETHQIILEGHRLDEVLEGVHLQVDIDSKIQLSPDRQLQIEAQNVWLFRDIQILGKTYRLQPTDLAISFDPEHGLQIEMDQNGDIQGPYQPELAPHALKLIVDGPHYLQAMLQAIRSAQKWIDLESFLYVPGETSHQLTWALLQKAAGLKLDETGSWESDPLCPQGIPVFVLFSNLELKPEASEPVLAHFAQARQELEQALSQSQLSHRQQQHALKRLEDNFFYRSYVEGVARADHRKLLLIDGWLCFLGGINIGDKFLAPDSFHDLMVACVGPAVAKAQEAFMQNWWRVNQHAWHPEPKSLLSLQYRARQQARLWHSPLAQAELILTDARKTEIGAALSHCIEAAQQHIWLEHAYFYHPETLRALKKALDRGVKIRVILPEQSNIEIYNYTNAEHLRQLMLHQQQSGQGQLRIWFYTGNGALYRRCPFCGPTGTADF